MISNSWGGTYDSSDDTYDSTDFNHPGIFVASGDCGYNSDDPSCGGGGVDYPSTSVHAIAVGGTSLTKTSGGRGWTETAWSDGGSSCNTAFTAPSFQNGFVTSATCAGRATTDVSAVADPNTGVTVYNKGRAGIV
ncbi:MAG TPA: hypothetical protein VH143_32670, partial [Kofleriaceae bacterium]|nr:hypothetical protein [Kofleriaceae bacterium]